MSRCPRRALLLVVRCPFPISSYYLFLDSLLPSCAGRFAPILSLIIGVLLVPVAGVRPPFPLLTPSALSLSSDRDRFTPFWIVLPPLVALFGPLWVPLRLALLCLLRVLGSLSLHPLASAPTVALMLGPCALSLTSLSRFPFGLAMSAPSRLISFVAILFCPPCPSSCARLLLPAS